MRRREFLQAASAATFTASLARPLRALPVDNPYVRRIGLQLWTVRFQLEEDPVATLKSVADAGYHQVELMDVIKSQPTATIAADFGLDYTSAFIDWNVIVNPQLPDLASEEELIDVANRMGLRYLVFGYIGKGHRETVDQFKRIAARANSFGEKCAAAGIQLCYHNHSFEFLQLDGGVTGFEVLEAEFDRQRVKFELDVFWVAIGGWDPADTMRRLEGRTAQLHLKDLLADSPVNHDESTVPHEAFKELGAGTVDLDKVLKLASPLGVEQCHVEQDRSPDPLASIRTSMAYLRA